MKPILGLEVDLLLPYRLSTSQQPPITGNLVLLAQDSTGWKNISTISSILLTRPAEEQPFLTLDLLSSFNNHLICLTGGCRGVLQRLLHQSDDTQVAQKMLGSLKDIFGKRLYIELNSQLSTDSEANQQLIELAHLSEVPLVAAHNIFYLERRHESLQRTVSAIRTIKPLTILPAETAAPDEAFFIPPQELERRFKELPRALAVTKEIAAQCNLEFDFTTRRYPMISLSSGQDPVEVLRQKALDGARRLYGSVTHEVARRLENELDVITVKGYAPIFLIAEEMVSYSRQNGIPSASRGSASSSLVAHCIGITTPDPLGLDLYFERFLNPARTTPPDIDTDFCSRRRDEVIQHLFNVYGQDRVAMVGTINTFRPRSALSEVAKAHGLKSQEIHSLVSGLAHRYYHPNPEAAARSEQQPFAELAARYSGRQRYTLLFEEAEALLGLPHHLSVHAGGVVIAPEPIVGCVPIARSGGKGLNITQFDLDDVEQMGLIKLDLLGIRGLTVLGDVASGIHSWRRKEFHTPLEVLESVPEDDAETAALISTGRTIGCFQIESPGMRSTLKEIHAHSIPDIMAALALYRPGPLKGGLRDAFVRRHNQIESIEHIHPALSGLLSETYGVILYQEQVLRIANGLAGFSFSEADLLRRAMSHFDPGKQMLALRQKFIERAEDLKGVSAETGARIWDMMAAFAGYGFPKAHAASYALVAWRSAWCKAHYPAEFLAAVLANWGGYYPQSVYMNEARRIGLCIRPPHINHSMPQFSVAYPQRDPVLFMGLDQVSELTRRTQARIIRWRPFHSLAEFIEKVDPRHQEAEFLIQAGALAGIGSIPALLQELSSGHRHPGQLSLFSLDVPPDEDWSDNEKAAAQKRILGTSLEIHPLERIAQQLSEINAVNTIEAASRVGEKVQVAGMRQTSHRSLTSKNEWMSFMTIEDLEGMLDVVIFPDVYRAYRPALSTSGQAALLIEGTVDRDANTGEPILRAEKISRID